MNVYLSTTVLYELGFKNMKSVTEFFPLIDDPANIFYSKLKNIFLYGIQSKPTIYDINRVKRTIEFNICGETHIILKNYDARKIHLDKSLRGKFAYLPLLFKTDLLKKDTTVGGELVDVNVGRIKFSRIVPDYTKGDKYNNIDGFVQTSNLPFIFISFSDDRINEFNEIKIIERIVNGTHEELIIGLPLGIVGLDPEKDLYDISILPSGNLTTSKFYKHNPSRYNDDYRSIYRPVIGRKFVVDESTNESKWYLYDIDSNYEEILIDSYDNKPIYYNHSNRWPYYYGNTIPCTNKLRLFHSETENHVYSFIIVDRVCGKDYSNKETKEIKLIHKDINSINYYLENDMQVRMNSVRPINPYFDNRNYKVEYDIIIDCYLTNINIRYYLLSYFDESLRVTRFHNSENRYTFNDGLGGSYDVYPEIETLKPEAQGMEPVIWKDLNPPSGTPAKDAINSFTSSLKDMYNRTFTHNMYEFSTEAYYYKNNPQYEAHYINSPIFNCLCFSLYCPYDKEKKIQRESYNVGRLSYYLNSSAKGGLKTIKCSPITNLCKSFERTINYIKYTNLLDASIKGMIEHPDLKDDTLTNYKFMIGYTDSQGIIDSTGVTLKDIYGNNLYLESQPTELILFGISKNRDYSNPNNMLFENPYLPSSTSTNNLSLEYDEHNINVKTTSGSVSKELIESFIIIYK